MKPSNVVLSAKNRLGFIDGSIPKLPTPDSTYASWMRCNYMVLAWITNSLSSDLSNYTLYFESASQVWKELKMRFSRSSNNRIYMLEQQLINTKQEGTAISMYFSKLKSIWDEIAVYEQPCSCNAPNCGTLTMMNKRNEARKVMQFLMGLMKPMRSQVMLKDPLPNLDDVFSLIVQEESNNKLNFIAHTPMKSAAIMTKVENTPSAAAIN